MSSNRPGFPLVMISQGSSVEMTKTVQPEGTGRPNALQSYWTIWEAESELWGLHLRVQSHF